MSQQVEYERIPAPQCPKATRAESYLAADPAPCCPRLPRSARASPLRRPRHSQLLHVAAQAQGFVPPGFSAAALGYC